MGNKTVEYHIFPPQNDCECSNNVVDFNDFSKL